MNRNPVACLVLARARLSSWMSARSLSHVQWTKTQYPLSAFRAAHRLGTMFAGARSAQIGYCRVVLELHDGQVPIHIRRCVDTDQSPWTKTPSSTISLYFSFSLFLFLIFFLFVGKGFQNFEISRLFPKCFVKKNKQFPNFLEKKNQLLNFVWKNVYLLFIITSKKIYTDFIKFIYWIHVFNARQSLATAQTLSGTKYEWRKFPLTISFCLFKSQLIFSKVIKYCFGYVWSGFFM